MVKSEPPDNHVKERGINDRGTKFRATRAETQVSSDELWDPPKFNLDELFSANKLNRKNEFNFEENLFRNRIELDRNKESQHFNFGPLLEHKMLEIRTEKQGYYFEQRDKPTTKLPRSELEEVEAQKLKSRPKYVFVRFGDFSSTEKLPGVKKGIGYWDRVAKPLRTTNCSTAILDALYRALGGRVTEKGLIVQYGVVNGVPLTDKMYSGFIKKFQSKHLWTQAIVEKKLGYEVEFTDLKRGDIIGRSTHRMIYIKTLESDPNTGWPKLIETLEANLPTGSLISYKKRKPNQSWKAVRIYDCVSKNFR